MLNKSAWLLMALVLGSLTSCRPIVRPTPVAQSNQTGAAMPISPLPPKSTDANILPEAAQARHDLATQLSMAEDKVEVVEAKAIVWPDSSLGCPEPGMVYAQVLQDGLLIVLRVNQKLYEYHSGGTRPPFLCKPSK